MVVRFSATKLRLDDKRVLEFIDKKSASAMNRVGGSGRLRARRKIRKQKKSVIQKSPTTEIDRNARPPGDVTFDGRVWRDRASGRVVAFVRRKTVARAQRGRPPRWRVRGPRTLKDEIWYFYDVNARTLFIGPILFSRKRQQGQTVPQWLENNGFKFMEPALQEMVADGTVPRSFSTTTS